MNEGKILKYFTIDLFCRDVLFHCDVIVMHFLNACCMILIYIFCTACRYGKLIVVSPISRCANYAYNHY
jgi:hypothetical protein